MLRRLFFLLLLAGIAGGAVYWWLTMPPKRLTVTGQVHTPDPKNGETIFNAGGCASCHATPNQPERTQLGGGLALTSPFGTFYVPNISSDANDGIGRWSEDDFVNAVKRGVSPEGEHYYPAFPYASYAHATTQDVRDLFAFLKTLPPVKSQVRDHDLRFPFNIRRNVGVWKLLFFDDSLFSPDQSRSPSWNRGAYLVNSLGHCAECHSPRNFLGGIITAQRFAGGPNPEGKGWIPNITQKGLSDWSQKDIAGLLENGGTPDGDTVGGSMAPVIKNTSQLSAADRDAMAEYLKSLPSVEGPKRPPK